MAWIWVQMTDFRELASTKTEDMQLVHRLPAANIENTLNNRTKTMSLSNGEIFTRI